MQNKKYIIQPGYVISENDGQKHYVPADRLMRLYRVRHQECVVVHSYDEALFIKRQLPHAIILKPSRTGRYVCPDELIDIPSKS